VYLKVVQDKYVTADGTAALKIRITLNRTVLHSPLDLRIEPAYFNAATGSVKPGKRNSQQLNAVINKRMAELYDLLLEMRLNGRLNPEQLRTELSGTHIRDAYQFIDAVVESHRQNTGTYRSRKALANKLRLFAPALSFHQITTLWLRRLDQWLIEKNQAAATRYILFKFIRNVCNLARKEGLIKHDPFSDFEMPTGHVKREGLSRDEVDKLLSLNLTGLDATCRDIFVFQAHCLGMRIGDALTLRTDQIREGVLYYTMQKTGDVLQIDLTEFVLSKVDYSKTHLFSFPGSDTRDFNYISRITALINKRLKGIAERAGIDKPISTKYARLTWANLAKSASGGNMRLLQDALGHESIVTTEIYAGGPDFKAVNALNKAMWG
jgi:integrase/recombinase XerD